MTEEKSSSIVITEKTIDIKGVFSSKNPRLAKLLPGFIFRFIKNIIHEDIVNSTLYKYRDLRGIDFVEACKNEFGVTVEVNNSENIPKEGRYICAGNHPLGGPDGWAIIHAVAKYRRDILFPVNDLLMNLPVFEGIFIPINKHGSNAAIIEEFNKSFEEEKLILYFPAGLVSRRIKGEIIDLEWKHTFINKARQYKRDVIPVHISGRNSSLFYTIANLRKFFKIKANLEMFLLPNEIVNQKGKTIEVTFGDPIPYTTFDKSKRPKEWAQFVKDKVYTLRKA